MKYLKSYNENTFIRNPMQLYSSTYEEDMKLLDKARLDIKDILLEVEDEGFGTIVSNRTWSKAVGSQSGHIYNKDRTKYYKCYSMIIDITKLGYDFDINDIKETLFRLEDYVKTNLPGFNMEYIDNVDTRIKERERHGNMFTSKELYVKIVKIAINRENLEYN